MDNEKQPLTVRALTKYIKLKFDYDQNLQGILLKGELSNFKKHSRGHFYFTLKDEDAQINAVMFAQSAKSVTFLPKDGMGVIVKGNLSVYEAGGSYSIQVRQLKEDGIGNLYAAFNQMKERLGKEGLFDPRHKKTLPKFPESIGIITSPTGAAIRDILSTIRRRFPATRIFIYPALVQGENAAASIVSCIKQANILKQADVLIVGRGGGSIEDLWAFNEEAVARAVFESELPIISAVGHETDITIADFVADLRAPTPTGAAEMAVPSLPDVLNYFNQLQSRLNAGLSMQLGTKKEKLSRLQGHYIFKNPSTLFESKRMHLENLTEKLHYLVMKNQKEKKQRMQHLCQLLLNRSPVRSLEFKKQKLIHLEAALHQLSDRTLLNYKGQYGQALAKLELLNPLSILTKGYAVLNDPFQKPLKSTAQLKKGSKITGQLADGDFTAVIEEVNPNKNFEVSI